MLKLITLYGSPSISMVSPFLISDVSTATESEDDDSNLVGRTATGENAVAATRSPHASSGRRRVMMMKREVNDASCGEAGTGGT
jgi:hypothetical protein